MRDENRKVITKQHKVTRSTQTKNDPPEKAQMKIQTYMREFYLAKTPGKETIDRTDHFLLYYFQLLPFLKKTAAPVGMHLLLLLYNK
eukprot:13886964-Ditylum_brightwellii.AAC.1